MIYSNLFSPTKNESHFHHDTPQATFCQAPLETNTKQQDTNRPKFYPTPYAPRLALPYPHLWCIHFRPPKNLGV